MIDAVLLALASSSISSFWNRKKIIKLTVFFSFQLRFQNNMLFWFSHSLRFEDFINTNFYCFWLFCYFDFNGTCNFLPIYIFSIFTTRNTTEFFPVRKILAFILDLFIYLHTGCDCSIIVTAQEVK